MSFSGNLKTVGFGDILQLVAGGKKTGALVVTSGELTKKVYFSGGDITAAVSIPPQEEERLGRVLVRRGVMTEAQLESALRRQKTTGKKLGHVLISSGQVSRADLIPSLQAQAEEIVYGLFGWGEADFQFVDGEEPEPGQMLISVNTLNVMMEGARRYDEFAQIASTLPDYAVRLRIAQNPALADEAITLNRTAAEVLAMIQAGETVGGILAACAAGEHAAAVSLHDMITAGLVESSPHQRSSETARAEEDSLYGLIFKLYSHSIGVVHKELVEQLGVGGERLFARKFDDDNTMTGTGNLAELLEDGENTDSLQTFLGRVRQIAEPIRLHKVLGEAARTLERRLGDLNDRTGCLVTARVVSGIQKDLAFLLAQRRSLADKYDIAAEFKRSLKWD